MLPFSQIRKSESGTFYVSGQLPTHLDADPGEQTASCLEAIGAVLEQNGIDKSRVLKTTLFTIDLDELPAINKAYFKFFEGLEMPARSAFGVTSLAKGAKVEIDCYGEI